MNYKFLSLLFLVISLKAYNSELSTKLIQLYSDPKFSEKFVKEIEKINEVERRRKFAFINLEVPGDGESVTFLCEYDQIYHDLEREILSRLSRRDFEKISEFDWRRLLVSVDSERECNLNRITKALGMPKSIFEDKYLKWMIIFEHDRTVRDAVALAIRNKLSPKKIEKILNRYN